MVWKSKHLTHNGLTQAIITDGAQILKLATHFNRFLLPTLAILLAFTQCAKRKIYTDDTFFNTKVIILGHRGMGVEYYKPENTYESIIPALGIGADGCEIDIQMTKDSVLVLYHDPD